MFLKAYSSCHLDRSATRQLSLSKTSGAEWRDPEAAYSGMLHQGVLTRLPASAVGATSERFFRVQVHRSGQPPEAKHGENSLRHHGEGCFFGIPRLGAPDSLGHEDPEALRSE